MMWFFRHFWIFISYHIFLLNQVEGAIAIPPSNSAPLPLFCPSVCPSVCPSIGLLTTFSGFCTFADKSLGRNGIELEMQMFPDDLPLANIDADGYCCHFMRSSVRPTIHGLGFVYFIQSAWKKWPTIWHADVSRWLTLSIHGCLWILLLVCLSVHLSVCSFTAFSGGCAFADKSLGTNGIKFGAKEGGSHYWEMAVAITCGYGGYLLPLLAAHSSSMMISMLSTMLQYLHYQYNADTAVCRKPIRDWHGLRGWVCVGVFSSCCMDFENWKFRGLPEGNYPIKSSPPGQNGRHYGRRHFHMHFLEWKS